MLIYQYTFTLIEATTKINVKVIHIIHTFVLRNKECLTFRAKPRKQETWSTLINPLETIDF